MISFAVNVLVQLSMVVGAQADFTYKAAYHQSVENGKPLLVLVGADWCPACQTMKHRIMPALRSGGDLAGVEFAIVNSDRQSRLASRLMSGSSIPQLIVFYKDADGWKRKQLTGSQAVGTVRTFVAGAVKRTVVARQASQEVKK